MLVKRKFKIIDMHCVSCALIIDMSLEDLDGIKQARTSYAKAETEIEFDPEKVDEGKIIEVVKKSGYTAVTSQ